MTATLIPSQVPVLLKGVRSIETAATQIIERLPEYDDVQIIQIAVSAGSLEDAAFRIRGACASEFRRRLADKLPGGRGQKDDAGVGVMRQLGKLAEQIGVDVRTLTRDCAIHETFFAKNTVGLEAQSLLKRSHYALALTTPEPQKIIKLIAAKLEAEPECSTKVISRLVEKSLGRNVKAQLSIAANSPLNKFQQQALKEHIAHASEVIDKLFHECPSPRIGEKYRELLDYLRSQLLRTPKSEMQDVLEALDRGCYTVTDMADETGLEEARIEELLPELIRRELVEEVAQGGKPDGARGRRKRLFYLTDKGVPPVIEGGEYY